jgi:hypothetical protein
MKKFLKITGVIVVLFIAALIIIPIAFKGKIVELIKTEANKNLNANLEFADVDLSLIRSFPNLSVNIEELCITGIEAFEGDTLTYMKNLRLTVDVMSVISGSQIGVKRIALDNPVIKIKVLADGKANYDIAKESAEAETPVAETESAPVKLEIDEYTISNGRVIYDDSTLPMVMLLGGLDHTGKGNFTDDVFTLYSTSTIKVVDVVYDGVRYIKNATGELKADLAMDMVNMKFTFMENELLLNRLGVGFDGWLAMPADDIDMDITFAAKRTDLLAILSLVPAEFATDLEGVDARGTLAFDGYVKGIYNDNSMPGYGINLAVKDGRIQYPELPRSIENIAIDMKVVSPEGNDMDLLTLDIPKFYMEIGKMPGKPNTIDAELYLRRPMSDPLIKTRVDADLDLGSFKDVIPMDGEFSLAGLLAAHFALDGALSNIESQQFDKFKAEGNASLNEMSYADAEMKVAIPEARVTFSPQRLSVETFRVNYDEINMSIDGYLNNYVAYALTDTTLQGVFNFTADKINANKYMSDTDAAGTDSVATASSATDTTAMSVMEVPGNLDLVLNSTIGEILYEEMVLKNITGQITIKDQIAALRKLTFETLGGSVQMDGSYNTQNPAVPKMDFGYDIRNVDIRQTAEALKSIEKMAPIAKHASGKISSTFTLKTDLDAKMEPVYATMQGKGTLRTNSVVLEGGKFLEKLSSTLKSPQLARQELSDVNVSFVIQDGKITTDPFDIKINKMSANVSGYSSFDETLDYLMKMKIPRSELGGEFNKMAEGMMAQANAFLGGNLSMGEFINMNVRVHGNLYDPTISPGFAGMEGQSLKDQATEKVKEIVTEKIDEAVDKGREEADKKAQQLLADAQKQADKLKAEAAKAAKTVRDEGEKNAQKLVDDAKNPIAKAGAKLAADKLRDEANKRAKQIESEAAKQADDIMKKARAEADKIKAE